MVGDSGGDALAMFHPLVASWFRDRFARPTEPQLSGWPAIASGRDTLIAAPTGSGKTLAAFLWCLDRLIRRGLPEPLPDATDILYISPLKALSNDVHRNLEKPLAELREQFTKEGVRFPEIKVATRTGDTPASERVRMAKKPPHILVTTPESLYILLTADKSRAALSRVRTVIVDEIHAVAGSKRGAHLTLSLERLDRLVAQSGHEPPVRVGLSATQKPIDLIGEVLCGNRRDAPLILDGGHARELDLAIEMTDDELGPIASNEMCDRVYDRIADLVRQHETTLVFVNTRRLVERVAHKLEERLGEEQVVAHHGSLSKRLRFKAEQRLKYGQVKCAIATASLELGIDVGSVDLVVQIGSPRSIATLLQRIGRSGHSLGETPKGRLFALTRDQLVESAALVRAIRAKRLDAICMPEVPLDILSQQMVATTACEEIGDDELFELMRGSRYYRDLLRDDFEAVLAMLAEGASARRGRAQAHVHYDRVNGVIRGRRGARLASITNGGAIPDNANYAVIQYPEEIPVGSLDEDFAIESSAGDIFLLGNTSWRIRRIEAGRVIVEDAKGMPPTIPFWFGEAPARTAELSDEVGSLRRDFEDKLCDGLSIEELSAWLADACSMPKIASDQLAAYMSASRAALGALPTRTKLIAERFFDEAGGMQLVIHAPLGGQINKAWGLALRKRFCRSFNFELQAAATDDGIVISLGPPHSFPLEEVFQFLPSAKVRPVLEQATLDAPVFTTRWRWAVTRALAVLRRFGGKKVPPPILRMRTDDLLTLVFPMSQACLENVVGDVEIPDHPLVKETMKDCLHEFMDVDGLADVIRQIEVGEIEVLARDTVEPSPLSHELLNANPYAFLDDAPLEERRTRAVRLPRGLREHAGPGLGEIGIVEDEAIATAEAQAEAPVRDADELHDLLMTLYLVRERPEWSEHAELLIATGRATRLSWTCEQLAVRTEQVSSEASDRVEVRALVAAERVAFVSAALTDATADPELPPLAGCTEEPDPETAAATIVRSYLEQCGPRTADRLSVEIGLSRLAIVTGLLSLENEGAILRGRFSRASRDGGTSGETPGSRTTDHDDPSLEWCDRRMLARIHKLTLGRLRRGVEPVSAAALMRFLFAWQRVGTAGKQIGPDGLLRVIEQLQGFETAAGAWERDILPARMHNYDPALLDNLCYSGQVSWCRLSRKKPTAPGKKALTAPTRAAPLTLALRPDLDWLRAPSALAAADQDAGDDLSELAQKVAEFLRSRGASFLADIAKQTEDEPAAIEDALWELVGCGLASADGFSSMRLLVERKRDTKPSKFDTAGAGGDLRGKWKRAVKKARNRDRGRPSRAARSLPTAAGRWTMLGDPDVEAMDAELAARQLLLRYGIVFRDLLGRESALPPWRDILVCLRRLEARGEVRGGRFVAGFVGEQFALPEAVEGLRSMRRPPTGGPEIVEIPATDPLNMVGVTSAGPKVPAVIGNRVLYKNGAAIASIEGGELRLRAELETGERVDEELLYHPPPRVRIHDFQQQLLF